MSLIVFGEGGKHETQHDSSHTLLLGRFRVRSRKNSFAGRVAMLRARQYRRWRMSMLKP